MPPSTPALIRPRSIAAPTAISAVSVATGSGLPVRVVRVEEEALEQRGRVLRREEVAEPLRVVAEAQVELRADAAFERPDERPDDRELLHVGEVEAELRQRDLDERHRLAEQQVDEVDGCSRIGKSNAVVGSNARLNADVDEPCAPSVDGADGRLSGIFRLLRFGMCMRFWPAPRSRRPSGAVEERPVRAGSDSAVARTGGSPCGEHEVAEVELDVALARRLLHEVDEVVELARRSRGTP